MKTYKTLKQGDTGKAVKELQDWLNEFYGLNAVEVDGIFGNATADCVEAFQDQNNLEVDGIAGKETFDKLSELLPKQETKSLRERLECTLKEAPHVMALPPLSEPYLTIKHGFSDTFHHIVRYMDVQNNRKYKKKQDPETKKWSTYCNVYAYHFIWYTWAVLPRMWWDSRTFERIFSGDIIEPVYGENCFEVNANSLYYWLIEEGTNYFGWEKVETAQEFQKLINEGAVGVICAARKNKKRSGHITVGIPENKDHKMVNGVPLQSQAGWDNWNYHNKEWYKAPKFEGFGYFVNRQPKT